MYTIINKEVPPMTQSTNETERKQQTQMIMKLFELWHLTDKEKAIALGLSTGTQTSIHKYKTGKQNVPSTRDAQDRIGHLLAIHKFLRRAYPFNKELAYQWIKTINTDFNNHTPFDLISQRGYFGLLQVRYYLEMNEHQQDTAGNHTDCSSSLPGFFEIIPFKSLTPRSSCSSSIPARTQTYAKKNIRR
jgi:hypothetical protein